MNLNIKILKTLGQGALVASMVVLTACAPSKANEQSKFASWLPGMKPGSKKSAPASPIATAPQPTRQAPSAYRPPSGGMPGGAPVGNPQNLQAQLAQADQHYRSGAFAQAEQAYRVALNMDPRQPIAHYRLGNIAFRRGQYPQAAQFFQRAVELSPRNAKAHYNLGVVYLTLVEQHLKHYRATMPGDADTAKIAKLLQDIDDFASQRTAAPRNQSRDSLDALADALE